jgi:glyceraldehyde 3-phosphate dehydrogenase
MKKIKIAINGFGRIGRAVARINAQYNYFDLVLINDINPHVDNLAYLFKYDSTYGKFDGEVSNTLNEITINAASSACTCYANLEQIPWNEFKVDILIDSSGIEENVSKAKILAQNKLIGACIVTHSNKDVDLEVVVGVNDDEINSKHQVVSNSICDANAIAHVMKWMDEKYGIKSGSLTTLHPWLSYQNLVDGPAISQSNPGVVWTDYALGRASTDSLIPKNTTAMTAVEKVLPQLKGKILSFSYRIPTDIVATSDITINLQCDVTTNEVIDFLQEKCDQSIYVRVNTESLVSLDYEKDESSAVIDMQWIKTIDNVVKIVLWYDNEWGYSARVLDLAKKLTRIQNND